MSSCNKNLKLDFFIGKKFEEVAKRAEENPSDFMIHHLYWKLEGEKI